MTRRKHRGRHAKGRIKRRQEWDTYVGAVEMMSPSGITAAIARTPTQVVWLDGDGLHSARLTSSGREWAVLIDDGLIVISGEAALGLRLQPGIYQPAGDTKRHPVKKLDPVRVALLIAETAMGTNGLESCA